MSHLWIILFFLFFIISSCLSAALRAHLIPEEDRGVPNNNNGAVSLEPLFKSRRNLLSVEDPTDDTIFVTALDGTVYSVNSSSADVHWSFPSGPSIYSAYQALPSGAENTLDNDEGTMSNMNYNYLDVTDDWKLALIGPNNTVIKKYHMTMDEFLNGLPNISDHGEVTTGKKKTTVFALDAYSGRKIFEYTLDSSSDAKVEDSKKLVEYPSLDWQPIKLIYLTRKDYFLQSFWMSGQIKWNLAVAEISVSFPQGHMEDRLSSYEGDPKALSSYKGRIVHRVRVVPKAKQRDEVVSAKVELALPGPDSNLDTPDETSIPSYSNWGEITSRLTKIIGTLGFATFLLYRLSRMSFVEAARRFKFLKLIKDSREKQTTASKRKKSRKLGNNKNNANFEQNSMAVVKNDGEPILEEMTKSINGGSGRKIGKLFVSNTEISKGSNGTVVLEGNHEGRPVAVKRIVKAHNDAAFKEIQNLIASDHHPNIVRWYGVEYDSDFVYLSLERCTCNLNDLIQICSTSQSSLIVDDQNINSISEYNVQLNSVHGISKGIELWKTNGHPSPQLLKLMRDVVSGLAHLHELGIIHRDLKPQNVLILKERSLCVKLSDMGISKRLIGDMSSLGHHATGSGSSGWQAPEQLLHGRQTRAVDIFSLGCVLFFCITGGKHPFGDRLERDINIVKNRLDLFMVDHIPEAVDLLSQLLNFDPELRPKALEVLHHPLFWTSETRLSFLRDTSDRVELEDRETESDLLKALQKIAPVALGGKWDEKMEPTFINNIGRYRRYKFDSTRDLLRVIRNKFNHYRELPKDIQEILGPVPEGFSEYFASRFPRFLIEVYKVMYKYCKEEEFFSKYFKSSLH